MRLELPRQAAQAEVVGRSTCPIPGQSHIDYAAEGVLEVFRKRETLHGLRITQAPKRPAALHRALRAALNGVNSPCSSRLPRTRGADTGSCAR